MKKISTLIGRDARWTQPRALKQEYELRVGDELAATLRFRGSFHRDATGESADGCWKFRRSGVFSPTIVVHACNDGTEIGTFRGSWKCNSGTLELAGGPTFHASSNLWMSRFTFADPSDRPIIELKNRGCLHHSADLHIAPGTASMPELPLLVLLGWYLDMSAQHDAGVAAAAAG